MMGFSSTPVYYAQTPQEDSIVFTLTSGYNATTATIERVNVRTGHVIQHLTIDKDDILPRWAKPDANGAITNI